MRVLSARLGRVHVRVRDLGRATRFYTRVLGFRVSQEAPGLVFLTSGAAHHEVVLSAGASDARVPMAAGCSTVGFEVPGRVALADMCERLVQSGARVAVTDQGISWSVHTSDPDGNSVEVYCDTRKDAGGSALWRGSGRTVTLEELQAARRAVADDNPQLPNPNSQIPTSRNCREWHRVGGWELEVGS